VINLASREEALAYPRGRIELAWCRGCGFIWNAAFDQSLIEYSPRFEESQGFSDTYNSFAGSQARRLVERYGLRGRTILEIGCGKGEFLAALCEFGENKGIGFDPAYRSGRIPNSVASRITIIQDYYSEAYSSTRADFVCCRMTLEHIPDTGRFVAMVRRAIGPNPGTPVFFQVPDAARILRDCAFEDIYYDHCSYFDAASLRRLFSSRGFEVVDLRSEYDGQYLSIEARPATTAQDAWRSDGAGEGEQHGSAREAEVRAFPRKYSDKVRGWEDRLEALRHDGRRAVLWGSGSKAVTFLNTIAASRDIEHVVDINTYRQGSFVAGSGQAIVAPEFLRQYRPDVVIAMNPIYRAEIRRDLDRLDLRPELLTL
jgi:SAM-dependent methyltransferase